MVKLEDLNACHDGHNIALGKKMMHCGPKVINELNAMQHT